MSASSMMNMLSQYTRLEHKFTLKTLITYDQKSLFDQKEGFVNIKELKSKLLSS
jgi:hypothetical protein